MRESARRMERENRERQVRKRPRGARFFEASSRTSEAEAEEDDDDDEDDEEDEEDDRPASLSRLNRPTLALHPTCTHAECTWWVVRAQTGYDEEWRNPVEASRVSLRLLLDYADEKDRDKGR
ncbi:hypothetical protein ACFW04_014377 [Cataglyphis niger]